MTQTKRERWQELEKEWRELKDKMPEGKAGELVALRREFGYSGVEKAKK